MKYQPAATMLTISTAPMISAAAWVGLVMGARSCGSPHLAVWPRHGLRRTPTRPRFPAIGLPAIGLTAAWRTANWLATGDLAGGLATQRRSTDALTAAGRKV